MQASCPRDGISRRRSFFFRNRRGLTPYGKKLFTVYKYKMMSAEMMSASLKPADAAADSGQMANGCSRSPQVLAGTRPMQIPKSLHIIPSNA